MNGERKALTLSRAGETGSFMLQKVSRASICLRTPKDQGLAAIRSKCAGIGLGMREVANMGRDVDSPMTLGNYRLMYMR